MRRRVGSYISKQDFSFVPCSKKCMTVSRHPFVTTGRSIVGGVDHISYPTGPEWRSEGSYGHGGAVSDIPTPQDLLSGDPATAECLMLLPHRT